MQLFVSASTNKALLNNAVELCSVNNIINFFGNTSKQKNNIKPYRQYVVLQESKLKRYVQNNNNNNITIIIIIIDLVGCQ